MAGYRLCRCCKKRFTLKRNPQQVYCSNKRCQQYRKMVWRKSKMKHDADYRANQKAANKRWQSKNPHYWRQYRATHAEYLDRNRRAQQVRDGCVGLHTSHLAKSDALSEQSLVTPGMYWITPGTNESLAKSDALLVKILVLPGQNGNKAHLAKR